MKMSKLKTSLGSILFAALASMTFLSAPQKADAQEPLLGEARLFATNFCPRGWFAAEGQILPISQNTALFSLYGTMYGGDGRTTFALPDLRGRAPVAYGTGPGLNTYSMGQKAGAERFTITENQMPSHNHIMNSTNATANKHGPGTDYLATPYNADGSKLNIYHDGPPNKQMDPGMIANTGVGEPVTHRGPVLAMRWCVALQGIYPSRN